MKRKLIAACAVMLVGATEISAQHLSVKGKVLGDDGLPVIGAEVKVKDSKIKTVTDIDGQFVLNNLSATDKKLIISSFGMRSQEVAVKPNIQIVLVSNEKEMDEVMVVAYGTAKKYSFTGSAEVIDAEKIKDRPVANVTKAIEGSVSGVQMTSGTGQPGEGAKMIIRGFGSINADVNPLYVVDGVPYDGNISAINPNDIENITVLKDASAGALYGARGANGVVMITTKRGTSGKAKVSLKANWGFASRALPEYETMGNKEWLEAAFQSFKNQAMSKGKSAAEAGAFAIANISGQMLGDNEEYNPYTQPLASIMDPLTGKISPDAVMRYGKTNWLDEITEKAPLRQEYVVSVTGGSDNTKGMISAGYLDEKGLQKTTGFQRYSLRANGESQVTKWFRAGVNLNYARNESNSTATNMPVEEGVLPPSTSSNSNVWYTGQLTGPIYPVYKKDANGNNILENGKPVFDYGLGRPAGAQNNWNILATTIDDKYENFSDNLSGRANIVLGDTKEGPLQGLSFISNFGFDLINGNYTTYYNPYNGNAASRKGLIQKENTRDFSYTWNQMGQYKRTFGDHSIDILAGHEFYYMHNDYLTATRSGLPYGGVTDLDAATTMLGSGSYQNEYAIQSFLGRVNYNFADKYYLSGSYRTDGSSRFAKENRWGHFWSVGGNWRISHEKFMQDVEWVDNLSLKASYGVQGNDNIGDYYAWQKKYIFRNNGNTSGAIVSKLGNDELKWEKNANFNIGVEGRLFDRLSVSLEWYNRKTTDMLMEFPMPSSTGFDYYNANVGSMRNRGFDVALAVDIFKDRDLFWRLGVMGSTIDNKVLKLADKPEIISGSRIIKEGEVLNSFYLPTAAGVDPKTGDQLYRVWDEDENGKRTYYLTSDENKANKCRSIQGSRLPKIYGSINSDFRYKNFDFSMLFTYSIGGKILDGTYVELLYSNYIGQNRHAHLNRAWKQEGDITDIPRIDYSHTHRANSNDLVNASYFSMKNVTLGYTLPKSWMRKIGFESIRVTASADNLFMCTHLKGMNPQHNFSGSTDFTYTPVRTVTFGLDIKF